MQLLCRFRDWEGLGLRLRYCAIGRKVGRGGGWLRSGFGRRGLRATGDMEEMSKEEVEAQGSESEASGYAEDI